MHIEIVVVRSFCNGTTTGAMYVKAKSNTIILTRGIRDIVFFRDMTYRALFKSDSL